MRKQHDRVNQQTGGARLQGIAVPGHNHSCHVQGGRCQCMWSFNMVCSHHPSFFYPTGLKYITCSQCMWLFNMACPHQSGRLYKLLPSLTLAKDDYSNVDTFATQLGWYNLWRKAKGAKSLGLIGMRSPPLP